jgi:beta-lactam-binding protein with PASTA domain
MALNDATGWIQGAGFRWYWITVNDPAPPGTVIRQAPAPGAIAPMNSTVTIEVASGESRPLLVTVPDVIGLAEGDAVRAIGDMGLYADVQDAPAPEDVAAGRGQVWLMAPGPGSEVAVSSTVTIVVAT